MSRLEQLKTLSNLSWQHLEKTKDNLKNHLSNILIYTIILVLFPLVIIIKAFFSYKERRKECKNFLKTLPYCAKDFICSLATIPYCLASISIETAKIVNKNLITPLSSGIETIYDATIKATKIKYLLGITFVLLIALTLTGYYTSLPVVLPAAAVGTITIGILAILSVFSKKNNSVVGFKQDRQMSSKEKFSYLVTSALAPISVFVLEITGLYYFSTFSLFLAALAPSLIMMPTVLYKILPKEPECERKNRVSQFVEDNFELYTKRSTNGLN